jgi:hypothetical protein
MGRALFAALLILIVAPPARADVRIMASPRGAVGPHLARERAIILQSTIGS